MRRPISQLLVLALAVAWSASANAQYASPVKERGIAFDFALTGALPLGEAESRFNPGAGFLIGVGYDFSSRFSLLGEYSLTWFDVKTSVLPSADLNGYQLLHSGLLSFLLNVLTNETGGLYLIGGPGLYYRNVEITRFAGTTVTTFCDPWLLVCYPTAVPVDEVLGSASTTGFGVNAGVGGFLRLGPLVELYLEARYHYVWGDEIETPSGPRDSDAQFLPINLGIRL